MTEPDPPPDTGPDAGPDAGAGAERRAAFAAFFVDAEPRLRAGLVAYYGAEVGRDAAAEALTWAWKHWDRVATLDNPVGYLFRVGQSKSRALRRVAPRFPAAPPTSNPDIEPRLPEALASLTDKQRAAVVLAHGFGLTHAEVAEVLGIRRSTAQNHIERGMAKLRAALEVTDEP